ncbi:type II and III secretion system protein [Solidesulfovibrio carbinoliphilus subsp. oakridgensis]|uniref:Type II and III secretion system protein n=1 Tax=Solidesulfovibrio carbinoliphilus subsp. oakridgensis TaxID=694327 RepID=G7QB69_9BACT|nr:type IVB pilus formation outer membrane protein, R64 PilN family [Solidesulfovibrio carbinoliphilus]EHJ48811.1 type II and III secretion system protein [Solidesulfovibrio carbinoliphilus subsp. oakridgensis]
MIRGFGIILAMLIVAGCTPKARINPEIEAQGDSFREQSRSKSVQVVDEPYMGARIIPLQPTNPVLDKHVMLRRKGSLLNIAAVISELTALSVQVAPDSDENSKKSPSEPHSHALPDAAGAGQGGSGVNLELEALLQKSGGGGHGLESLTTGLGDGKTLSISYEGKLRGLLDTVAMQSGYGWDYDQKTNIITFAKMVVRTFTIAGAPGTISYRNQLTNKSKENSSSGVSSSNVNQTVQREDTSAQNAQLNSTSLNYDIWADTERNIKALLTPKGVVVSNQSAGSMTVRDTPDSVRRVATYVEDLNVRLSRQVALNVQVWSLNVTDNAEAGINLQALFQDSNLTVAAGSLSEVGAINTATATILSGKLKDSAGVLKALGQWGKASQVTSAGGLVMSGQPVPVMAVQRHAYLAGVGKSTTDYSQTTEVTPGEVTTGFAMTVIPHILDQRRVILQYNLNLSSLDEMKEFTTSDVTIELPQVSTQAFSQRSTMKLGQTLVLCGFEKESNSNKKTLGFINASRASDYGRTLLVITIRLESADV